LNPIPRHRREVGVREHDGAQVVSVRPEVVHLGAVRGVVVDEDEHRQLSRTTVSSSLAPISAAVAERGDGQAAGLGERSTDRCRQAQTDRLESLGPQ
jgi:hypothetical protein